jgi:hypothetical protein
MHVIEILSFLVRFHGVPIEKEKMISEVPLMKSENSTSQRTRYYDEELQTVSATRFVDEKISDDSGTEAKIAEKALAPAGLKNPFWK